MQTITLEIGGSWVIRTISAKDIVSIPAGKYTVKYKSGIPYIDDDKKTYFFHHDGPVFGFALGATEKTKPTYTAAEVSFDCMKASCEKYDKLLSANKDKAVLVVKNG